MAEKRPLPLGKIEPNSAKYFYSCALGGIIGTAPSFLGEKESAC